MASLEELGHLRKSHRINNLDCFTIHQKNESSSKLKNSSDFSTIDQKMTILLKYLIRLLPRSLVVRAKPNKHN